ncbi:hypothetical protein Tco_1152974 [Tanacetum coccineum]
MFSLDLGVLFPAILRAALREEMGKHKIYVSILVTLVGLLRAIAPLFDFSHSNYGGIIRLTQDWMIQQKFVGLAVVDVYGLENECTCTK